MQSASPGPKKALILAMPFATPEFPPLGATLIRSVLVASGVPADIVYGHLVFSKLVAGDPFVETSLSQVPICEIAFTPYYFDRSVEQAAEALREYVLEMALNAAAHPLERYIGIVRNAGRCVDSLFESIRWEEYDVVGFSLLMGQTVSSLALAKRIKEAHPDISIIIGGAQTQSPMGEEMLRSFRDFDYVVQGEADGIVAPFIQELRLGKRRDFVTPGVLYRDESGRPQSSGDTAPFTEMDELPVPDFSDFFAQMDGLGLTHIAPYLPLETSRGCWWGQKHHCTFCGIDDKIMVYRSKSPERALQEIVTLSQRHQYTEFFTVDSIINFKFFNELLPVLGQLRRKRRWDFTFFFETKSNISRDQARRFRYGGVNQVQPGVESFNDHVLELMDKGTTAVRQIQCLKLLAEQEIIASWNLIIRNPGETEADYRELVDLIPFLHHLPPLHEGGLIPMQINRYAPYHNEPARYGITNIRPKPYYEKIYPRDSVDLNRLGFYFDCDFKLPQSEEMAGLHASLGEAMATWRDCYIPNALLQFNGPNFVRVVDRRSWQPGAPVTPGKEREYVFKGVAARVFSYCADMRTIGAVHRQFCDELSDKELDALVDRFVSLRLMYRSSSNEVISLPLVTEALSHFRFVPGSVAGKAEKLESLVPAGTLVAAAAGAAASDDGRLAVRTKSSPYSGASGSGSVLGDIQASAPSQLERVLQVGRRPPLLVLEDLEATADRTGSLRFKLEGLESANGIDLELLEALAQVRGERHLGYEFSGEVRSVPDVEVAEQMRYAGISSVRLANSVGEEECCPIAANLQRIGAVKALRAANISVEWELDSRTWFMSLEDQKRMADICLAAGHLPNPQLGGVEPTGPLAEALRLWSATYRSRILTYARGPEFIRIFERRENDRNWRFLNLRGVYAEVLLSCERPQSIAGLLSEMGGLTEHQISVCLDALMSQGLICASNDRYLALPIRRAIEERWASGDN
jgi:ribosomal peptide maturation radical SAM protein 1